MSDSQLNVKEFDSSRRAQRRKPLFGEKSIGGRPFLFLVSKKADTKLEYEHGFSKLPTRKRGTNGQSHYREMFLGTVDEKTVSCDVSLDREQELHDECKNYETANRLYQEACWLLDEQGYFPRTLADRERGLAMWKDVDKLEAKEQEMDATKNASLSLAKWQTKLKIEQLKDRSPKINLGKWSKKLF